MTKFKFNRNYVIGRDKPVIGYDENGNPWVDIEECYIIPMELCKAKFGKRGKKRGNLLKLELIEDINEKNMCICK